MKTSFTILLLSEHSGKKFSTRLSHTALRIITGCALFVVCACLISTSGYLYMCNKNRLHTNAVVSLTHNVEQLRAETRETSRYRAWAEDIIFKRVNHYAVSGKGASSINENTLDGEIAALDKEIESLVGIEDFTISRINLTLDFDCSFKLCNTSGRGMPQSGYLFVIASNRETIPPAYQAWPETVLNGSAPRDHTTGSTYSIRYMKKVNARIRQPDIGPKYNRVDVVAYSEDGTQVMQKGFYIERMLQESPYE